MQRISALAALLTIVLVGCAKSDLSVQTNNRNEYLMDGYGGDGDGDPDPCPGDADTDGDGICDKDDPCPDDPENKDADNDGICDDDDYCPNDPGVGDDDHDGICNSEDDCPDDPNNDSDGDGLCDKDDPCPDMNPNDSNGNGTPDCEEAVSYGFPSSSCTAGHLGIGLPIRVAHCSCRQPVADCTDPDCTSCGTASQEYCDGTDVTDSYNPFNLFWCTSSEVAECADYCTNASACEIKCEAAF